MAAFSGITPAGDSHATSFVPVHAGYASYLDWFAIYFSINPFIEQSNL